LLFKLQITNPMKRVVTPELLDAEGWTQPQLGTALADLRMVNRWFGGVSTTTAMLRTVARRRQLREISMLDVGGADGTVARATEKELGESGIRFRAVVADRAASHITGGTTGVGADAAALPFRSASFDVVGCALLVHHLAPEQVRDFVREGLRVARHAVLINDLRRSPVHLALVYAGFSLYRSPLTRNDAPASVRAAYTPEEIRELLKDLSADIEITHHYLYRMAVIVWKR
jgi:ubiquinone/menaquinone biosynthesis C-methylase UbiE